MVTHWAFVTNSFAVNPAINQPLTYDTLKDFAGGQHGGSRCQLCSSRTRQFAPNTVAELVALARKTGEPLNFTSPGPRTVGHLAGAWLENLAGIKLTHIAYNGSAPALTDVIAGSRADHVRPVEFGKAPMWPTAG